MFLKWITISKFIERPYSNWLKPSLLYDEMPEISSPSERKHNEYFEVPSLSCDENVPKTHMKPVELALQELVPYPEDYDFFKEMMDGCVYIDKHKETLFENLLYGWLFERQQENLLFTNDR
jgi:hypothetical protein